MKEEKYAEEKQRIYHRLRGCGRCIFLLTDVVMSDQVTLSTAIRLGSGNAENDSERQLCTGDDGEKAAATYETDRLP
ncbi:MAG: hypothetical protein ACLTSZ_08980 [Lachnospiraceae bacterium]